MVKKIGMLLLCFYCVTGYATFPSWIENKIKTGFKLVGESTPLINTGLTITNLILTHWKEDPTAALTKKTAHLRYHAEYLQWLQLMKQQNSELNKLSYVQLQVVTLQMKTIASMHRHALSTKL